jgi:hypothetical protein
MRIRLGDLLVKAGVITDAQLKAALAEQQQWGGKLGDILVRMEFVTEEVLVRALSKQTGIPRANLAGDGLPESLAKVPAEVAEEFGVIPVGLQDEGRTLVVAMSDPLNLMVTDHLRSVTGCKLVTQIAGTSAIRDAISRWYRGVAQLSSSEEEVSQVRVTNSAGATVASMPTGKRPSTSQAAEPPAGGAPAVVAPPPAPGPRPPPLPGAQLPARPQSASVLEARAAPEAPPPPAGVVATDSALEVLRSIEETQRRSVSALKAMVELLIEKGVFSRDEYLARVRR